MWESYVVYILWDPTDGAVRYVGKTKNPKVRLNEHRHGKCNTTRCAEWEAQLVAQDLCCQCAVVEEGLDKESAYEKERWWIEIGYKKFGWPLTNMKYSFVGDGGPWRKAMGEWYKERMDREWRETEAQVAWWDAEIKARWSKGHFEEEDAQRAGAGKEKDTQRILAEQNRLELDLWHREQLCLEHQFNAKQQNSDLSPVPPAP